MRRSLIGLVVAASAALVPMWALAGNQEVAEKIAANLKQSGQLHGYKIAVKYQDGTAWLKGQVASQEQIAVAVQVANQTQGVSKVVNDLSVAAGDRATESVDPPLKQTDGALAAEQFQQPISRDVRVGPAAPALAPDLAPPVQRPIADQQAASPIAVDPAPARTHALADRLAESFAATPVRQVNATLVQEPTTAPPQQTTPAPQKETVTAAVPAVVTSQPIPVAYVQAPPPPPASMPTPAPAPLPTAPSNTPLPMAQPNGQPPAAPVVSGPMPGGPLPMGSAPIRYDQPNCPNYAWPTYAPYPNYAALTYPKQYSPTAWPYIGPFYPYPQVPLGWRKVTLEWHDGWWFLDFDDGSSKGPFTGLFRGAKWH